VNGHVNVDGHEIEIGIEIGIGIGIGIEIGIAIAFAPDPDPDFDPDSDLDGLSSDGRMSLRRSAGGVLYRSRTRSRDAQASREQMK